MTQTSLDSIEAEFERQRLAGIKEETFKRHGSVPHWKKTYLHDFYVSKENKAWQDMIIKLGDSECDICCGYEEVYKMKAFRIIPVLDNLEIKTHADNGRCLCAKCHHDYTTYLRRRHKRSTLNRYLEYKRDYYL
jgi:hypothetical protein